jgi:hypothetical protein
MRNGHADDYDRDSLHGVLGVVRSTEQLQLPEETMTGTIHEHKKSATVQATITANDGQIAIASMPAPSTETLRIIRYGSIQTEQYFRAQWAVGKSITVEGRK